MDTNANSIQTALALASARKGTFTGLIIQKSGAARGRGENRKVYGDDLVHVVLYTGFDYMRLVQRSLDALPPQGSDEMDDLCDMIVGRCARMGLTDKDGETIEYADAAQAIKELRQSFMKTLAGVNESTSSHVFDPLEVDGEAVRGCKVYKCVAESGVKCHCQNCTGDKNAPTPGQIHLAGLKIGETVLEEAENGPIPRSKSAAHVVAKNVLRQSLPVGRYVSYRLDKGRDYILRAGGAAALAATQDGVTVDPEAVEQASQLLGVDAA